MFNPKSDLLLSLPLLISASTLTCNTFIFFHVTPWICCRISYSYHSNQPKNHVHWMHLWEEEGKKPPTIVPYQLLAQNPLRGRKGNTRRSLELPAVYPTCLAVSLRAPSLLPGSIPLVWPLEVDVAKEQESRREMQAGNFFCLTSCHISFWTV